MKVAQLNVGPTWSQVHMGENIDTRFVTSAQYVGEGYGQSFYQLCCPFCCQTVRAYAWSLRAVGKRCGCGALISGERKAYHWIS